MSLGIHCDREHCSTWVYEANADEGWLALIGGAPGALPSHFCSIDCLMQWAAANSEPTERISL